ncbi:MULTISPECIES: NAD(P)-dependent oxidoreductase [Brevibacterium]|uniref:Nucleoside-diphosphate-sugar epimerase n=1 Tax=Brevibacterium antiquum CNRZ 918 TaxID=1255637 RepID=A0A2H1KN56_9MICO|nr:MULTISPECIES: NAD(P)-dependent oxidoreductase [Brevibacterium]SMY00642.1 Nucleoside-diphosphate-sugar epimerase [Brevibacterium antiquum CNRZ 918]HCG57433.1 NAD(P)-dependent oxidoreductase [Brevibacterium sp.]
MAVIVTGASGFIGGAIARALTARDETVYALGRRDPEIPGVNFQAWDLTEPASEAVKSLASKTSAVFHCAGIAEVSADDDELYSVKVTGTRNVLDAFAKARIVHISSTTVYSPNKPHVDLWEEAGPKDPNDFHDAYSKTHALAEQLVTRIRPDAAILRPAAVYGPGETMLMPHLSRVARKGVLRLPGRGRQKITLTHIDNLVRAAIACVDVPSASGPFNIGDPTPYKLKDAVSTHFARMEYEPVVIEAIAKDKALFTAKLGLKIKTFFHQGNRAELFFVEYLQHDRTYNLTRQQRVLGISTTQFLLPSRFQ